MEPVTADGGFSPIDNELPLRWLRRWHLVPEDGLGTIRRAVFLLAVTWLPIALWAATAGQLLDSTTGEPLLRHYGVHVRCLLAIPLFILAEGPFHATVVRIARLFVSSGIVPPAQRAGFADTLLAARGLRDSTMPWIFVAGATFAWLMVDHPSAKDDVYSWAVASDGSLGFGGWWYAYVARPVFVALLLGWLWRIVLVTVWFWRIERLELSLVPTHPDRTGGLAFVERLPAAFSMVTFALTAVFASTWAHDIEFHGASLQSMTLPAAAFIVFWALFALLPLLALIPLLLATRKRAVADYSTLVGEQGRLVHRRWILREQVADDAILDAPEIGPVADAATLYDAVRKMRTVPIGKGALFSIFVPVAVPLIVVAALRVPIGEMLWKLVKTVL